MLYSLLRTFSLKSNGQKIIRSSIPFDLSSHCYQKIWAASNKTFNKVVQEDLPSEKDELKMTRDTIAKVNNIVKEGKEGRLFGVIHLCGKQFKITAEDIILVEGFWPPQNGDEIKFEKVLLVGGVDFTLIGRPILPQDLVSIKATVIEKALSHTKTIFYKKRRKQYMRINFYKSLTTMIRINEISITGKINEHKDTIQFERR